GNSRPSGGPGVQLEVLIQPFTEAATFINSNDLRGNLATLIVIPKRRECQSEPFGQLWQDRSRPGVEELVDAGDGWLQCIVRLNRTIRFRVEDRRSILTAR